MTKKILAVVLAAALLLTCGVLVFAEDTTQSNEVKLFANLITDQVDKEEAIGSVAIENDAITVPECTATKEFFVFDSWNIHADGSGAAYQPGDVIEGEDLYELVDVQKDDGSVEQQRVLITLYAQWVSENAEYEEYSVYYDANGGEGETIDDMTYLADSYAMVAFNEFTAPLENLEFFQWNTKPDASGDAYNEFDEIHVVDQDITLYAIWWDPETETLYNPNAGNNGSTEPSDPGNDDNSEVEETTTATDAETDTDAEEDFDTEIPETGDASSVAIALAAATVAMGALVVLKKKD